jgi:hypothetical protein
MYTVYVKANYGGIDKDKRKSPVELINVDNIEAFILPDKSNDNSIVLCTTGHTKSTRSKLAVGVLN